MSDKIWIFDTTLRDGEQALKASLSERDKIKLAHAIARLNVDVMEVGFPVSSPADFRSVQTIAREVKGPIICGLARAVAADIEACGEAIKVAEQGRIHTFIATSPIHLQHKLKKSLSEATEMAVGAIKLARRYTDDVEFSCEDAARTPVADLCRIIEAAIAAGARTINIPDTVGYTTPQEFFNIIQGIKQGVPNIDLARISVHCHNDLGLAVANSISAISAGARQIECTVNGIGERAGNCSLEEVAMILKTRSSFFNAYTDVKSEEIYRASRLVSQICNMPVQPNKAIVGENAFAHSSGIHQDGVLKAQHTYEIMQPQQVGVPTNALNLTSRSGRHVLVHRLKELGYQSDDYDLDALYQSFLQLADQKGTVYDYDLEALIYINQLAQSDDRYQLQYVHATCTSQTKSSATVCLTIDGTEQTEAATGNGPVEAAFAAIARMVQKEIKVVNYQLTATGEGAEALGQVDMIARFNQQNYHGSGLATDIVEASVRAMVHVLNLTARAEQIDQLKHHKHSLTVNKAG